MLQAQIFIDKDNLIHSQTLYEFIMQFLLRHNVKGATAFTGMMGFGINHKIKRPNQIFSFDDPSMMIVFIDEDEKVLSVLKLLREQYKGGLIITHPVDLIDA